MEPDLNEGILTANRIRELERNPVIGIFDTQHLLEVHRRIFQDLTHHGPGQFRIDAPGWVKARQLEVGDRYYVPYAPRRVIEPMLDRVLPGSGPAGFQTLSLDTFAARLADLYADLDYLHPFREGNSRTLRTFTRQWAGEAGFDLNWVPSSADAGARDRLYRARDVAVMNRAFPGLDEQRAFATDDRLEYECYGVLQRFRNVPLLAQLIRASTTYRRPEGAGDERQPG